MAPMKQNHIKSFGDAAQAPKTPPGPVMRWGGWPWMQALAKDFTGFMQQLQREHGDITYSRVMWERIYTVFSPELMREVVVDNAAHLIRQERAVEVLAEAQGQSVMVSEGEQWQRQHRMLKPGFAPRRVAGYANLMVDAARRCLDEAGPTQPGASALVNVTELMSRLPMDVIMRTLFSSQAGEESLEVAEAVKTLDEIAMDEFFWPTTLPDWLPLPGKARKRWALRVLNGLIERHIRERKQMDPVSAPKDDLLAMLLAVHDDAPDGSSQAGQGLSDIELHDQCKIMFLAGYETTATALTWWTWLLAAHPDVAERARQEIDSHIGQRDPTPEDMPKLEWLTATLKEAMRLYPPALGLVTRRTTADIQVGGWTIPKRSLIMVTHWVAHHDERWFPQPEAFQPERFMPDAPAIPRGAWMPFGAGPRVCIGQHFAMLEMTLIAAMLLQRYTLCTESTEPQPRPEVKVTLRPADVLRVRFTRR
jgi:cytochrome P450